MATLESLRAMLARGQDSALLRYSLGAEHLKLKQYDAAVEHLRQAIAREAAYSAAWKLLGQALASAGREAEAIAAYQQGIGVAQSRGDVQAAKEMGVFLRRLQK